MNQPRTASSAARAAIEPMTVPAIAPPLRLWDFLDWTGVVVLLVGAVELVELVEATEAVELVEMEEVVLLLVVLAEASVMLM